MRGYSKVGGAYPFEVVVFIVDVEVFYVGGIAVENLDGTIDRQYAVIAYNKVMEMIGVEVEWEELPLVGSELLLKELPEEFLVWPFARSDTPWQVVVCKFVADEQSLQVQNGFGSAIYESREDS